LNKLKGIKLKGGVVAKGIGFILMLMLFPSITFAFDTFHYDAATGKCLNGNGEEGLNHPDLSAIFRYDQGAGTGSDGPTISNKDLECADLSSVSFRGILNSGASYVHLVHWNLKGAHLSQSDVKWMSFEGGCVAGVNFAESHIGYTMFRSAQIDSHTHGLSDFCMSTAQQGRIQCQM
jgi:uncharacterized protein YjbI with pentapeptide repeats